MVICIKRFWNVWKSSRGQVVPLDEELVGSKSLFTDNGRLVTANNRTGGRGGIISAISCAVAKMAHVFQLALPTRQTQGAIPSMPCLSP